MFAPSSPGTRAAASTTSPPTIEVPMRTYSCVSLVLATLAFASTHAQTPQRQGSITGRVIDQSNGQPVPSASVVVTGSGMGAITTDSGTYAIRGVPAGTHQLRASRVGYGPSVRTVAVTAGGVATADFVISHVPF